MDIREVFKTQLNQEAWLTRPDVPKSRALYTYVERLDGTSQVQRIWLEELDEFAKTYEYVRSGEEDGRGKDTIPVYKQLVEDKIEV